MAKADANKVAPAAEPTAGPAPLKLLVLGIITLGIALTIIISMGSRLGGCMYLDGSH